MKERMKKGRNEEKMKERKIAYKKYTRLVKRVLRSYQLLYYALSSHYND